FGCRRQQPSAPATTPELTSSSFSSEEAQTPASYEGVLEKAGPGIYMQGTHTLTLNDGRSVLLESAAVDLDAYVGQKVDVAGSLRDTVEADGKILTVARVTALGAAEGSSPATSSGESAQDSSSSAQESSLASASSRRGLRSSS